MRLDDVWIDLFLVDVHVVVFDENEVRFGLFTKAVRVALRCVLVNERDDALFNVFAERMSNRVLQFICMLRMWVD